MAKNAENIPIKLKKGEKWKEMNRKQQESSVWMDAKAE